MAFDQAKYIESSKSVLRSFVKSIFPEYNVKLGFDNTGEDTLQLTNPEIYIEYLNDMNVFLYAGKRTGTGKRHKKKLLNFNILIYSTGDLTNLLKRDRIAQTLELAFCEESNLQFLSGEGLHKSELRFGNSYRIREGVHVTRMALTTEINIIR